MRKGLAIAIIVLLIVDIAFMLGAYMRFNSANNRLDELELLTNQQEQAISHDALYNILVNPSEMFQFLEDNPEWEEIEAVPYSKCYRHMVQDVDVLVGDYIMCQAI